MHVASESDTDGGRDKVFGSKIFDLTMLFFRLVHTW